MPGTSNPAIEVRGVSRRFGATVALSDVTLEVRQGEIHALLGPNGAGKTTLLRILAGLTEPSAGSARVMGRDVVRQRAEALRTLSVIPTGDRSFYHRLSGLENLAFFGRLYGLSRREAVRRARETIDAVGLGGQEHLDVGRYSQGMQKRLAIARAIMTDSAVLLVDEATHDLDPDGARQVRTLIRASADRRAAVLWATQRVEEIRDFADSVTLLHHGVVRFAGTPPQLVGLTAPSSFLIRVRNGAVSPDGLHSALQAAIGPLGQIAADRGEDGEHYVLTVGDATTLGEAIAAITRGGIQVLSCHETRSGIEQAFMTLTQRGSA